MQIEPGTKADLTGLAEKAKKAWPEEIVREVRTQFDERTVSETIIQMKQSLELL